jgi:septum formation protein
VNKKNKIILASASPRRVELLKNIGLIPEKIIPADVDETPLKAEKPANYVQRIAELKAQKIRETEHNKTEENSFIIAADTIACVGARILGKPSDETDARRIMRLLSGRRHRVYTCVVVIAPDGRMHKRNVCTFVKFKRITDAELNEYIATNYWQGKAGAYGLQEDVGGFVISINGSFSSVVGLPLYETKCLLSGLGFVK